jgi:hypothetical protein
MSAPATHAHASAARMQRRLSARGFALFFTLVKIVDDFRMFRDGYRKVIVREWFVEFDP